MKRRRRTPTGEAHQVTTMFNHAVVILWCFLIGWFVDVGCSHCGTGPKLFLHFWYESVSDLIQEKKKKKPQQQSDFLVVHSHVSYRLHHQTPFTNHLILRVVS